MPLTPAFLDTFSVFAFLRPLCSTCLEQMILSYLLSADDLLKKDNGVHALPVQALAELNGCQNRAVYTALTKLEGKSHLLVEHAATNASPPMVRLTVEVPEQRGLFMSIPLVPPVLDKPKEPKTDRGMPAYAKKLGEYKRSLAVARLRGAELLAYHAVRTVSHSIPASKAAAKGRKAASYGRLIGTAGLMAWIPGTEKTLGAVLGSLVEKKLLWREVEKARSNNLRTVYSYTPAPASDFSAQKVVVEEEPRETSWKTNSGRPAKIRSWEECTKPRPMKTLRDLQREVKNNKYWLEHMKNVAILRGELLENLTRSFRITDTVQDLKGELEKERHYVQNAYQPQYCTAQLWKLANNFDTPIGTLNSLEVLDDSEQKLRELEEKLKRLENNLPERLLSNIDEVKRSIAYYAQTTHPTKRQEQEAIMEITCAPPISMLLLAKEHGILNNAILDKYRRSVMEELALQPELAEYTKLNSRFTELVKLVESGERLPEDEPEKVEPETGQAAAELEPEESETVPGEAERPATGTAADEWFKLYNNRNKMTLSMITGVESGWETPAAQAAVRKADADFYPFALLVALEEQACLDDEVLAIWGEKALLELAALGEEKPDMYASIMADSRSAGLLKRLGGGGAPVTPVTANSGEVDRAGV